MNRLPAEFDEAGDTATTCGRAGRSITFRVLPCHDESAHLRYHQIYDVTAVLEDRAKEKFRRSIASPFHPEPSKKVTEINAAEWLC